MHLKEQAGIQKVCWLPRARQIVLSFLILVATVSTGQAADVQPAHPVYPFLERMELLGFFDTQLSSTRPFSRTEIVELLKNIEAQRNSLNRTDRAQLDRYRYEFVVDPDELRLEDPDTYRPAWTPITHSALFRKVHLFSNDRDMASFKGPDWYMALNAGITTHVRHVEGTNQHPGGTEYLSQPGYTARLTYRNFAIESFASDAAVRGDEAIYDTVAFPYNKFGDPDKQGFDFFKTITTLSYESSHISIMFGKSTNSWGHGNYGNLMLSDLSLPYTQLRVKAQFKPFTLTAVQGKLVQDPAVISKLDTLSSGQQRIQYADKWIAAHRIDVDISPNLQIGAFEMVVYGERGYDVQYLHPLIFIRGEEHYLRDRDNVMIGLDARLLLFNRLSLYAEMLLDDQKWSDVGKSLYTNKTAFLFNASMADLLLPNSLYTLEYARFSPYVYSHNFQINTAQQYGVNLGYLAPSNSDILTAGLLYTPVYWATIGAIVSHQRHGANTREGKNIGGDVRVPFAENGQVHVPFLGGDLRTQDDLQFKLILAPVYDLEIETVLWHSWSSTEFETGGSVEDDWSSFLISLRWHPMFPSQLR